MALSVPINLHTSWDGFVRHAMHQEYYETDIVGCDNQDASPDLLICSNSKQTGGGHSATIAQP